jgi:hypothetical protein
MEQPATELVPYYGVHNTPDGIAYLQQGRGGTNAVGLRAKSPFYVRLPGKPRPCNHQISLSSPIPDPSHWDRFLRIINDPLVKIMLPVPTPIPTPPVYLPVTSLNEYIVALSRLTSPIYSVVYPIWVVPLEEINSQLATSNIQPLVLIDVKSKDTMLLPKLHMVSITQPRRLLLVGESNVIRPPGIETISTSIDKLVKLDDLSVLPLEQLGAMVLRRHMRRVKIDAPLDAPMEKRT